MPFGALVVAMSLFLTTGVQIVGLEIAGDVDIALLQQQALRCAFLHVAIDDAGERRLGALVVVVALHAR